MQAQWIRFRMLVRQVLAERHTAGFHEQQCQKARVEGDQRWHSGKRDNVPSPIVTDLELARIDGAVKLARDQAILEQPLRLFSKDLLDNCPEIRVGARCPDAGRIEGAVAFWD